jgi:serine/threonine-protein kinase RsbW
MEARWSVTAELPGTGQASASARELLRVFLASCDRLDLLEDASLVLSELVANAIQHGSDGGSISLGLGGYARGRLRIEVTDPSGDVPVMSRPAMDAENGRGLLIVQALSARWGVERHEGGGKSVWAELG